MALGGDREMKGMDFNTVIQTPRGSVVQYKTKNGQVKARIEWNPNFGSKRTERFSKAQKFIDSEVLRLSDPYIPMQSGALRKSGQLATVIGSGVVVWNAPYARYQYYGKLMVGRAPKTLTSIDLQYHGGGKRGSMWFERMKIDHKKDIIQGAAKIAGGKA